MSLVLLSQTYQGASLPSKGINKHFIPVAPADRGSAAQLINTSRVLQQTVSQAGVVGTAANVNGITLSTSTTGARAVIQGPGASGPAVVAGGGQGFFLVNDSGDVIVSLTPTGLDITGKSGLSVVVGTAGGEGVVIQDASNPVIADAGEGIFVTNSSGVVVVSLTPTNGLELPGGLLDIGQPQNSVSWLVDDIIAYVSASDSSTLIYVDDAPVFQGNSIGMFLDSGIDTFIAIGDAYSGTPALGVIQVTSDYTWTFNQDGDGGTVLPSHLAFGSGGLTGQVTFRSSTGAPGADGIAGNDGDYYFRVDGAAGSSIYQKISGTWTALA